jgi:hypothetical protein
LTAVLSGLRAQSNGCHQHGGRRIRETATPVDDFAALLSDARVYQFLARPKRDLEGDRNSGQNSGSIAAFFDATGFWRAIANDPFDRAEWLEAVRIAPSIKSDFYTVLSSRDCLLEIESALHSDPNLRKCFRQ